MPGLDGSKLLLRMSAAGHEQVTCPCSGGLQVLGTSPHPGTLPGCRTFNIIHPHETIPRVIWGFHDTISVGLLPIAGFPNGHAFFTQRLYEVSSPAVGSQGSILPEPHCLCIAAVLLVCSG